MLIFIIAALISVGCSLAVITQKSPVRAVIFLIMAFVAQAILFVQLGGLFVAALQIIVYAGAILVLFLFIIMLLNLRKDEFGRDEHAVQRWVAFIFAGLLGIELLLVAVKGSGAGDKSAALPPDFGSVQTIGEKLFTTYLLPFEATSILLMAAILGAIVLAKRKLDD